MAQATAMRKLAKVVANKKIIKGNGEEMRTYLVHSSHNFAGWQCWFEHSRRRVSKVKTANVQKHAAPMNIIVVAIQMTNMQNNKIKKSINIEYSKSFISQR